MVDLIDEENDDDEHRAPRLDVQEMEEVTPRPRGGAVRQRSNQARDVPAVASRRSSRQRNDVYYEEEEDASDEEEDSDEENWVAEDSEEDSDY